MTDDLTLDDLPKPEDETTVHPDELEVDGDNPNEQSDEMFGLLCENLRKKGWLGNAIVADTDGCIADGEHRWRAAQEIGLDEVPVKYYDIDDAERRLWRQELNKISGSHDRKRDALEYDYLLDAGKTDAVTDLTKAAGEDLDELLAEIRVDTSTRAAYEYDTEHNVYFEDCVEGIRERLEDDSVDCVVTDPPYGMGFHNGRDEFDPEWRKGDRVKGWGGIDGDQTLDEALELLGETLSEVSRTLVEDGHAYIFCDWRGLDRVKPLVEKHLTVKNVLVWDKGSMGIGDLTNNWGYSHEFIIFATNSDRAHELVEANRNVLDHGRKSRESYEHPTEKPESLLVEIIQTATHPGDRVLDPFMGSGTTAVAAIQNNRDYVGFEIDADNYRDVIERRIGEAKRQREASVNQDDQEAASDD